MLTITRRTGQEVIITIPAGFNNAEEQHIKLTTLGHSGDEHKIGIDAPKEFKISRPLNSLFRARGRNPKQLDMFHGEFHGPK